MDTFLEEANEPCEMSRRETERREMISPWPSSDCRNRKVDPVSTVPKAREGPGEPVNHPGWSVDIIDESLVRKASLATGEHGVLQRAAYATLALRELLQAAQGCEFTVTHSRSELCIRRCAVPKC